MSVAAPSITAQSFSFQALECGWSYPPSELGRASPMAAAPSVRANPSSHRNSQKGHST